MNKSIGMGRFFWIEWGGLRVWTRFLGGLGEFSFLRVFMCVKMGCEIALER